MSPTRESATATADSANLQDLDRSKLLHGSTWHETKHQDSFISKLTGKNRQFLPEVVNQYMKNWTTNPSPGQEADKAVVENGSNITNLYFELSTDFYEVCVRYVWLDFQPFGTSSGTRNRTEKPHKKNSGILEQ